MNTAAIPLKGFAKAFYIAGIALLIAGLILSYAAIPAGATPISEMQLNLSHIECVNGQVEIHFVLLNVPDGITPGTLTYTYGTIQPGSHTGDVWHYTDYQASGYYDVASASVDVNGTTVTLHNPDAYAGDYQCSATATPTNTFTPTATETSTPTFTATATETSTPTFTPTATFTATVTENPSETATPTSTLVPTETPTSTATNTPFSALTFNFLCSLEGTSWRVSNPNPFDVTFSYKVNGGAATDFTVPANTSNLVFANAAPTTGNLSVSYEINGDPVDLSVVKDTACAVSQATTPAPTVQNSPVPTLGAPTAQSTSSVLIPVTGADLVQSSKQSTTAALPKVLFDFGFGFLGIGLVLKGISNKKDR